ncbi:MAG: sigma-70 family RNA polymerase sigma factor [Candidatus Poribacteria bacterium]|nr:sigma-70 family RNA polymerase sigma factor [Candidatus Poribacteria bacterium]
MKNDDAELIQRTLEGDQHAFAQLVEKYQEQVHTLAWQKIGDYHIAQEITQDVFITAYQKFPTFTHYRQFAGWLYVVTNRKCIAWHRKKKIETQSIDETNPTELDEVYYSEYMSQQREEAAKEERRTIVQKLLSKLQESDRTVMHLYYIVEMSCEEIAEFLGVAPNTVRSRLHRARNRLKKEEGVIKENLSSFQLPTQMTENIMKEISRLNPVAPSGSKPLVPLAVSAAAAILVLLLMGSGTQYLNRFQKPYSLNAQSEPTIEITDTQLVIDTPAKPAVRTQVGKSDVTGSPEGIGQKPDAPLFAAAQVDDNKISKSRRQWSNPKGPEGGKVVTLFATNRGDVYATAKNGLYRLADNGQSWKLINTIKHSARDIALGRNVFGHVAEWQDTLYRAIDSKIFASTDRGVTWKEFCECIKGELVGMVITDRIPGGQSDMTIYLAYEKGIFRSDNAGKSWTPLPEGIKDRQIGAITNIGNTVFAGTYKGLYRLNRDIWEQRFFGDIWEQRFFDRTGKKGNSFPILTLAASDSTLYVARANRDIHPTTLKYGISTKGSSPRLRSGWTWTLFQTTDRGDSWNFITPKGYYNDTYTISKASGAYTISKASGDSWNYITPKEGKLSDIFPSQYKESELPYMISVNLSVRIAASDKQVIVTDDWAHFYSTNAGKTWKTLNNPNDIGTASALVLLNENTFYRSGEFGIYRTTDGGKTWHQFNTGFVNTYIIELIAVNGVLYAHTHGGLLSSTDGGESWTPVPGDTGYITRIAHSNGQLYARDDKIGTPRFYRLSTKDNRLIDISKVPAFFNVYDPNKASEELREMNTTHGRPITSVLRGKVSFYTSMLGCFAVNDRTYYVEYMHKLFKWEPSLDDEWLDTGILDDSSEPIGFKLAVLGNTVYVGKSDGHLMRSVDQGNSWSYVTAKLPFSVDDFRAIVFAGNSVYVATDKGVVQSGNGADWHIITNAKGRPLVMNRLAVDGTTVYGESDQKIYQLNSIRGTWRKTWKQVTPKISHHVTCLAVDEGTLYVGTDGTGVLRFTLDN